MMKRIQFFRDLIFKCLFVSFLLSINTEASAQGGWNIAFLPVDSITVSWVGKKIKIDLKKQTERKRILDSGLVAHNIELSPGWYIRIADTVSLITRDEHFTALEMRPIGVDYGYYRDQYLILKATSTGETFEVWESEIITFDESSIHFRLFIKNKAGVLEKKVWIDRDLIDGLLYRSQ